MTWPACDFCPVMQQLARRFSFWHAWHVCIILASEIQLRVPASLHKLEQFFTLSQTLPLHDSHLNTELLIAKIQENLVRNKANKMVDKIQPYKIKTTFSIFHGVRKPSLFSSSFVELKEQLSQNLWFLSIQVKFCSFHFVIGFRFLV